MAISEETIEYLEKLSKLKLSEGEREKAKEDIGGILEFLDVLDGYSDNSDFDADKKSGSLRSDEVSNKEFENPGTYIVPKAFE